MTGLEFTYPEWLLTLLAGWLLVAAGMSAAIRAARNRRVRLLGTPGQGAGLGRDGVLAIVLGFVALGAAGPKCGSETVRIPASGVDVVVLLDVSRSMLARDVAPNRLARALRAADELLADLTEADRVALAAYAGQGVLITPLTPDKEALRALLPAVDPSLMAAGGSRLDQGMAAAVRAFDARDARPRVVVILGDGEDPDRRADLGLEAARHAQIRTVAAAFGSAAGAPVPAQTGTLKDSHGRPVVSRAHPERLAELAEGTGGELIRTDSAGRLDRAALLAAVRRDAPRSGAGFIERRLPVVRSDVCALLALVLLVAEGAHWFPARRRRVSPALVAAAGILLLGAAATPEATSREAPGLLREGVARAERGEWAEAEHAFFAALARAHDPVHAADAYYDLGVVALERRDYEAARTSFFDSLALRPGHRETQFNLEWTLIALDSAAAQSPDPEGRGEDAADAAEADSTEAARDAETQDSEEDSQSAAAEPSPTEQTRAPESKPGSATPSHDEPRRNPVELDPEAAERWLQAVEDDPQRSLRANTRGEARPARGSGGRW